MNSRQVLNLFALILKKKKQNKERSDKTERDKTYQGHIGND